MHIDDMIEIYAHMRNKTNNDWKMLNLLKKHKRNLIIRNIIKVTKIIMAIAGVTAVTLALYWAVVQLYINEICRWP